MSEGYGFVECPLCGEVEGYGFVECPLCGEVEHYGTPEDEAHCPCGEWEGNEGMDWIIYSGCKCPCHERGAV